MAIKLNDITSFIEKL